MRGVVRHAHRPIIVSRDGFPPIAAQAMMDHRARAIEVMIRWGLFSSGALFAVFAVPFLRCTFSETGTVPLLLVRF